MVVVSMLPHAEIGGNDHRKDAPQFILDVGDSIIIRLKPHEPGVSWSVIFGQKIHIVSISKCWFDNVFTTVSLRIVLPMENYRIFLLTIDTVLGSLS